MRCLMKSRAADKTARKEGVNVITTSSDTSATGSLTINRSAWLSSMSFSLQNQDLFYEPLLKSDSRDRMRGR